MSADDFEVNLNVSIRSYQGGGTVHLSERVTIPDCTFSNMAEIMRGFHQLATSMAEAKRKAAEKEATT
jgi:hypothetical protein